MSGVRLIAVLGYSNDSAEGLHEICAARLSRAERESETGDVVLLSGWGKGRAAESEAELMARTWNGRCREIVLDRHARSTLGNVLGAATLARTLDAREVLLVTSGWHARRAAVLLRMALRGSGSTVRLAPTDERGTLRTRVRELVCWTVVPFVALRVR